MNCFAIKYIELVHHNENNVHFQPQIKLLIDVKYGILVSKSYKRCHKTVADNNSNDVNLLSLIIAQQCCWFRPLKGLLNNGNMIFGETSALVSILRIQFSNFTVWFNEQSQINVKQIFTMSAN